MLPGPLPILSMLHGPVSFFTDYLTNKDYLGCSVGRVAGRITNGKFTLNGKEYSLECNNGPNHLHGGLKGFSKVRTSLEIEEAGQLG